MAADLSPYRLLLLAAALLSIGTTGFYSLLVVLIILSLHRNRRLVLFTYKDTYTNLDTCILYKTTQKFSITRHKYSHLCPSFHLYLSLIQDPDDQSCQSPLRPHSVSFDDLLSSQLSALAAQVSQDGSS